MTELNKQLMLPVFALILLYFITLMVMFKRRFSAVKNREIPATYFKTLNMPHDAKIPRLLEQVQRHFINLFEVPALFFALIPFILILDVNKTFYVCAAWLFVIFRYIHAFIHLTFNKLFYRAATFALGVFTLMAMWVHLFYDVWCS